MAHTLTFEEWKKQNKLQGRDIPCPNCKGKDERIVAECPVCEGTGRSNSLYPKYEQEMEEDQRKLKEYLKGSK